ncbi:hypothetical protein N7V53_15130 [Kosakonia sp. HypNH10]|uniref:hypothetical protein n=1 Tax=Kosakonia sp. HypNH10 TaxID=2980101 RepID=UPI00244CDE74|nr:hypothetical protein [Kosakonia sp. HypNH10]MDH2913854.1 hypothetical protein [Kosakonia sp. HypNH10]
MTVMTRRSALKIFSIYQVALLSRMDIDSLLFAGYNDEESGEPIIYESIYDDEVQAFLINFHTDVVFFGISNEYLISFLKKTL